MLIITTCVGIFTRNLKLHGLWLSGIQLFVNWYSEVDIFTVKQTVIYLCIELSVENRRGIKFCAAEYFFPRNHYLNITPETSSNLQCAAVGFQPEDDQ